MEFPKLNSKDHSQAIMIASLGVTGLVYLADYLSEKSKITPIWKYQSDPKLPLNWDKYARIISNPAMKSLAGGVISHHWDWYQIPDSEKYSQQWLRPQYDKFMDRFGNKQLTPFHHALAHMIFGIQEVCILGLDQDKLAEQGLEVEEYHYAFQVEGQETISKSRVGIPTNEQVRVLISTKPLRILALDLENRELPAKILGPFNRHEPDFKDLRQF